jgi:MerR family copper efflux transcriptional regulator
MKARLAASTKVPHGLPGDIADYVAGKHGIPVGTLSKAGKGMSIGQLAREAEVGVETIRFYERETLLPRARRTESNYRLYGPEALERLRFIRHAKDLGFTLEEIRRLLRLSVNAHSDAGDFHALAKEKIDWIDERVSQLRQMRDVLGAAIDACPGHGAGKDECPILALFTGMETPARSSHSMHDAKS